MNPLAFAALLVLASKREQNPSEKSPFFLKKGHTYRIRVLIHSINVPITQAMIDAARSETARFGIRDIKLTVADGKTTLDAMITPPMDWTLPGPGRVPIDAGPVHAVVEYIFARELGPPGV